MSAVRNLLPKSLTVDADSIRRYAVLTHDANPIHLDPDFAACTPMRGIIAHGTMSLNLIWQSLTTSLGIDAVTGLTLKVRFLRPVRIGDTVTAGGRRTDHDLAFDVWVKNGAGETVIEGTALAAPSANV